MTDQAAQVSVYDTLPPIAFWRPAVAECTPEDMRGIHTAPWQLSSKMRIATAGSCFAQHVGRYLKQAQFNVIDAEPAPISLPKSVRTTFGYGMYSARYGNIYTAASLRQLIEEVSGSFSPVNWIWMKEGRFFDAIRPTVEPNGHETEDEVREHRAAHLSRVRWMLEELDVFVFTLGLTEAWIDSESGTAFPLAPGVACSPIESGSVSFRNLRASEILEDMSTVVSLIDKLRPSSAKPWRMIVTVSPVPLTGTASGNHVLVANTESKAILRAVAGELAASSDRIDYFPSYEMVTNPAARGFFYAPNLRNVTEFGVSRVMDTFLHSYCPTLARKQHDASDSDGEARFPEHDLVSDDDEAEDAVCDQDLLESLAR